MQCLDRLVETYGKLNMAVERVSDGEVRIPGRIDEHSVRRNFGLEDFDFITEAVDGRTYTVIRYNEELAQSNSAPKEHTPIFARPAEEPEPVKKGMARMKRENKRIQESTVRSAARKQTIRSARKDSGVQAQPVSIPGQAIKTSYSGRAAAMKMNVDQLVDAVNGGDAEATLKLARLMESGTAGRIADPGLAVRLYGKAAEMGSPKGLYHLGMCYLHGVGFSREDAAYARYLLENAAELGDSSAKVSLKDADCEPCDAPAEGVNIMDIEHSDIRFRCRLF